MPTLSRVYRSRNCWLVQFSPSTCILHDTEAETTTSILNPDTVAADIHDGVWKPVPARAMLPPTLAAAIEDFVSWNDVNSPHLTIHTTRRIEVAGVLGPETTFRRLVPGRLTSSSDAVDATRDLLIRERADELHLPSPTFNPTKIPDRSVLKMHGADPRERSTDPPAEELVDQGRQGAGRRTLGGASVPTIAALNGSPFNHIHDAKRAIVETIKEKPLGDAVTLVNLNCEAVPAKR